MTDIIQYQHPGNNQQGRKVEALQPDYVSADGRTDFQLLQSILQRAKKLHLEHLLPLKDKELKALISYGRDPQSKILRDANLAPFLQPHQQLLMVFLQLFQHPRRQFDQLTRKHQDFYYQEVLKFSPESVVAHFVLINLKLANGKDSHLLKKGVLFDGGKDKNEQPRQYELLENTVINRSQLDEVRIHETGCTLVTYLYRRSKDKALTPFRPWRTNISARPRRLSEVLIITSPLLFLSEGNRKIKLNFKNVNFNSELRDNCKVHVSTEKGWVLITADFKFGENDTSTLIVKLSTEFPSITPLKLSKTPHNEQAFVAQENALALNYPKIAITPLIKDYVFVSQRSEEDICCDMEVSVEGLRDIKIRNERQVLYNNNSYKIFADTPKLGAKFYFAHREICGKKLSSLTIHPVWVPGAVENTKDNYPDINTIYKNYKLGMEVVVCPPCKKTECKTPSCDKKVCKLDIGQCAKINCKVPNCDKKKCDTSTFRDTFKFELGYVGKGGEGRSSEKSLFSEMVFPDVSSFMPIPGIYNTILSNKEAFPNDPLKWPITYRMTFSSGDFRYHQYIHERNRQAKIDAKSIIDKAYPHSISYKDKSVLSEGDLPKPGDIIHSPYTPELRLLTIDYKARVKAEIHSKVNRIYLTKETDDLDDLPVVNITKKSISDISEDYVQKIDFNHNVELLLKLSACPLNGSFSLFFEIEPLTGITLGDFDIKALNYLAALPLAMVDWFYKSALKINSAGEIWQPLIVTHDGTDCLQQSGRLVFNIPQINGEASSELWLKASIKSALALGRIIDISNQRVLVAYQLRKNPSSKSYQLEVNQITKLVKNDPAIETIHQPTGSFKGKDEESIKSMNIRVSEHLRHKQRALSCVDYERLILQQFPEITNVKCITANQLQELKAVNVLLLVIPKTKIQHTEQLPQIPIASTTLRDRIEQYISRFCSAQADIVVQNPNFVEVVCEIEVKFNTGFDLVNSKEKLNQDLIQLICPWAYHQDNLPVLGQMISTMALRSYLSKKHYIETVNKLDFKHVTKCEDNNYSKGRNNMFFLSSRQHEIKEES